MDFQKFCNDNRIQIAPPRHKHTRRGWINIECPFCTGNQGFHLGYKMGDKSGGFVCYRCGGKGLVSTIATLLGTTTTNAKSLIDSYGGVPYGVFVPKKRHNKSLTNLTPPCSLVDLNKTARKYLEGRNFDPDYISKMFDVKQTTPESRLKGRLYIPIKYHGYDVSYTCRSFVGSETRYMSCPLDNEIVPHKDYLYFLDNHHRRDRIVVVEGCLDVWRLGSGSVATFGTKLTNAQIKLLCNFKRIVLLKDSDNAGDVAWRGVAARLRFAGLRVDIVGLDGVGDAAELSQLEADYLMRTI